MELKSPAAARAAQQATFARIWQECEPIASRILRCRLSLRDAEDATQDVALKLFRAFRKKGPTPMHWPAYTVKTTTNLLATIKSEGKKQRQKLGPILSLEHRQDQALHSCGAENGLPNGVADSDRLADPNAIDPIDYAIGAEMISLIRPTFTSLPPEERVAFLARLHEATDKEAARDAGISESTALRRREHALARLQPVLRSAGYSPPSPLSPPSKEH